MSECIEWWGTRDAKGYGVKHVTDGTGRKMKKAHRLIYEECFGPIPGDLLVLHHCDNPPCVNPEHLHLGTPADNVREMLERGRGRFPGAPEKLTCPRNHQKERRAFGKLWCRECQRLATERWRSGSTSPSAVAFSSAKWRTE